jgi:hypothetical protein
MTHRIEVFRNNEWVHCNFQDLKAGEDFRMYEQEEVILFVGRAAIFRTGSDAKQINGKWFIEIIDPDEPNIQEKINGKF